MQKKITLLAVLAINILCFMPLQAQDRATRTHHFDLDGVEEIDGSELSG